jgi:hypothetical protein
MKENSINIRELIQEYLLDEGLLRNKLPDADQKLEFGFQFVFPPGPVSQKMVVLKPKNKDLIIISNPIQIAPQHIEALNSIDVSKKQSFFMELRKYFLAKDVFYRIDTQNSRYEISDQIFLKKDGSISKNSFFKSIRKVFTCSAFSNLILNEYCYGKLKSDDDSKSDEFTSNFSLYS